MRSGDDVRPIGSRALLKPAVLLHQIWRRSYVLRHPDHPWLDPGAISFLGRHLSPSMRGLEWGSGRSTSWIAGRIGHLTSVEHDLFWYRRVLSKLKQAGIDNVDLRFIPYLEQDASGTEDYWGPNPYVAVVETFEPESLDVVLVDGLFRQNCAARVLSKISRGGFLIIDNYRLLPRLTDWGVPLGWPLVYSGRRRFRDTAVWRRPPDGP